MVSLNWEIRNDLNRGKFLYLVFLFFLMSVLLWFFINQPAYSSTALIYFSLALFSLSFWIIDFATEHIKGESLINTITWERETLFGEMAGFWKYAYYIGVVVFGIMVFSSVASTGNSIIGTPTQVFQVIELGQFGQLAMTIMATISENLFFFYLMMPMIYGLFAWISRTPWLGFIIGVLLVAPLVFTAYHALVYGTANLTASISVFIFGFVNSFVVFIVRNPAFTDVFHASNNISVVIGNVKRIGLFVVNGGG